MFYIICRVTEYNDNNKKCEHGLTVVGKTNHFHTSNLKKETKNNDIVCVLCVKTMANNSKNRIKQENCLEFKNYFR